MIAHPARGDRARQVSYHGLPCSRDSDAVGGLTGFAGVGISSFVRASDIELLRRLYPFESRYLDIGGLRYHYIDEGRGEPIVMLHGNPTWSFYFRELVKGLRGSYRCIVPDHIGCGFSDKPGDDRYEYTLSRRADDLGALLDHLGLDRGVTLLMHDWGGMIGMVCAMRRPERISRLVGLNTAAFLKPAAKKMPWPLWVVHWRNPISALLVRGLNAFSVGATISATAKGM
jgi:cis-3-alkyl-4-acyloxetan-2-one decarboxylase